MNEENRSQSWEARQYGPCSAIGRLRSAVPLVCPTSREEVMFPLPGRTAWQACAYDLAKGRVQAGMRSYCMSDT